MSESHVQPSSSSPVSKVADKGNAQAGESELTVFNLRDTLSNISVRDANFGEFLSALKKFGTPAARP